MRRLLVILGILSGICFIPASATAQRHAPLGLEPIDVVRDVKAQLVVNGVDLDHGPGECGRFEITRRVGIALAGAGMRVGLIAKFGAQNKCADGAQPPREDGFAVDALMEPDGTVIDILCGGAEGRDTPCWLIQPTKTKPELWRSPFVGIADDASGDPTTVPVPTPESPATREDHDDLLRRLEAQLTTLREEVAALRLHADELSEQQTAEHEHTRREIKNFREAAKKASGKVLELLPTLLGALGLLR